MESGKLFIGGISWDTNEDRLREYFQNFGEVFEAVIMKDRATGRARGFGFVVFADPAVAERVVLEKHSIDGRSVEAKKAVPRDDQNILSKNGPTIGSSGHSSPGPTRTKKIFVGGLASNITESDFKKYFDRYGNITDVVVMYDHNTQRPRGFGFITFDSEESVDKVLLKNFHELNGKMVEVKRAIPKELSPGPTRAQLANGLGRFSSLLNGYTQGYVPNPDPRYGVRMEDILSPGPISMLRGGNGSIPHFGIMDQISSPRGFGVNGYFGSNLSYGMNPSNQWTSPPNRYSDYLGYGGGSGRIGAVGSVPGQTNHSLWGSEGLNPSMNVPSIRENGLGSFGGSNGSIWSGGAVSASASASNGENLRFGNNNGDIGYAPREGIFSRRGSIFPPSSTSVKSFDYEDLYENGSAYADSSSPWRSPPPERIDSGPFSFGLGTAASDVINMNSAGYVGGYGVVDKQPIRGIAALEC